MVQNKLSMEDVLKNAGTLSFPTSVIEFLQGMIGKTNKDWLIDAFSEDYQLAN